MAKGSRVLRVDLESIEEGVVGVGERERMLSGGEESLMRRRERRRIDEIRIVARDSAKATLKR